MQACIRLSTFVPSSQGMKLPFQSYDGAVMISDLLAVIDRLIKLKEHKEKRQSKRFEKVIEPAFNDLLRIHLDYIKMFEKVHELLPDANDSEGSPKYEKRLKRAGDYLAEKRLELEPVRVST